MRDDPDDRMGRDSTPPPPAAPPSRRARTLGWWGVAGWSGFGLVLEAAHAFKVSGYLDDPLTRMLLTLAHAHGVGASMLMILFSAHGAPHLARNDRHTEPLLIAGWALLPAGFLLGALGHPEGDPALGIALAPLGAVAFLAGLVRVARASTR